MEEGGNDIFMGDCVPGPGGSAGRVIQLLACSIGAIGAFITLLFKLLALSPSLHGP